MRTTLTTFAVSVLLFGIARPVPAQTFERARTLYAGAEYAEALSELTRIEETDEPLARRQILEYQALCLLALGRSAETEQAVGRLVQTYPSYAPDEVESPPQLRAIFRTVRQRQLPAIARERYAAAKGLLDRGDASAAVEAFEGVLALLDQEETAAGLGADDTADLRTLAGSFRDLARTRSTRGRPAEPGAVPTSGAAVPPAVSSAPAAASARAAKLLYGAEDKEVTAPVPLDQRMPPLRLSRPLTPFRPGLLVVVIDEKGAVESATLNMRIHPSYDGLLLERARTWRYTPATLNGQPVRFAKVIEVKVSPE